MVVDEEGNIISGEGAPKKKKQKNLAKMSLEELPITPKVRRIYYALSNKLEKYIKELDDLGIDWSALGEGEADSEFPFGGEGEFDPSMYLDGEGEFDPSMFAEGEFDPSMFAEGEFD
eukprot:UN04201